MARDHTMTAEEARTFQGFSLTNAQIVARAIASRGCACVPYADVFTYSRWRAQGRMVRKGEHGIRLTTYIAARRHDAVDDRQGVEIGTDRPEGRHVYPRVSFVFCRCQTDDPSVIRDVRRGPGDAAVDMVAGDGWILPRADAERFTFETIGGLVKGETA